VKPGRTAPELVSQSSHLPVSESRALLDSGEPPACRVINPHHSTPALIVCDHASNEIPRSLKKLGLPDASLHRHIALDIGAVEVAKHLADRLGATAILANYSRLVVDCNRAPDDPGAILALSDGQWIPGNQGLTDRERLLRLQEIHQPYHDTIAGELKRLSTGDCLPALLAIHSFTPMFEGAPRPWEVGILWDVDARIPVPLMDALATAGVIVGDNEPYSGKHPADYTMDHHGEGGGLAHASIEIRQDLIDTTEGARQWAAILATALQPILSDPTVHRMIQQEAAS